MSNKPASNNKTITVKTNEENPEPVELIAQSIIQIAEAAKRISESRLRKRAIVLLIKDAIPPKYKVGMTEIEQVLEAAESLKRHYIKDLPKPIK